jgi:hypothetical protein
MANAQEDLAKFVYRPKMKVIFFKESFDILATCLGSFFHKKSLVSSLPKLQNNNTIHPNLHYLKWAKLKLLEDFILPNFPFLI